VHITDVKINPKNKGIRDVYLDHHFAFSLEEEDYIRLGLYEREILTENERINILQEVILKGIKKKALHLVTMKKYTTYELKSKLCGKGYDEEMVDTAICFLSEQGYLDDLKVAKSFVQSRMKLKPKSIEMLKIELQKKGISNEYVSEALQGISVDEGELIWQLIQKKYIGQSSKKDYDTKKIIRFLLQRGFSYQHIKQVLKERMDFWLE
jgi:regulatory protein